MEELLELDTLFPIYLEDIELKKYLKHHMSHLTLCYENNLFSSGYPHLHIIYMLFIYFQLTRVAAYKPTNFRLCWIGMKKDDENFYFKNPTTTSFSRINEKTVFRFFRLLNITDEQIADLSTLINNRNDSLHATGNIYCESKDSFDRELSKYIKRMWKLIEFEKEFLDTIFNDKVKIYEVDYIIQYDDLELNFRDFSTYELLMLSNNKDDNVSRFIKEYLSN